MRIDIVGWQPLLSGGMGALLTFTHTHTHTYIILDMIAIIGTSDQSCWLAEACKIFFFFFLDKVS